MCNDVITLVKESAAVDEFGDTVMTRVSTMVFAQVKSVGMKEAYEAMTLGLKPEYTFVIADYYDYQGEEVVIYEEKEYRVLRTYRTGNALEIVVTKNAAA